MVIATSFTFGQKAKSGPQELLGETARYRAW
jgi:hypothetical protein